MRSYLLDTSLVSEFAPGRRHLPPWLSDWIINNEDRLFLSAIVVAEIEAGIRKLHRAGGEGRASLLADRLDELVRDFADRALPVDVRSARKAGAIADAAMAIGRHPGMADVLIAATASVHGFTLLTRNVRHFEPLGVDVLDPFSELPEKGS